MKRVHKISIIFCWLPLIISSQQLPRFSQYIMNEFIINPAVTGFDGRTTINFGARKEWLGFGDGLPTPETYSFSAQTRILKQPFNIRTGKSGKRKISKNKGRVGLGVNAFNDKNGAINRTGFQLTYAYHIYTQNTQYSFGLSALAFQLKIDKDYAGLKNPEDPLLSLIGKSTFIPDATIGFNLMTPHFHLGLSCAQVLQSKVKLGNNADFSLSNDLRFKRNYFIIGSYRNTLPRNKKWEYEPSFIIRANERPEINADLSLLFIYDREYWAGLSVRTVGDFILILGAKFNTIYFTYSFDYGVNGITRYTYGSHELTIAAKFGSSARRYPWIERY